MSDKLSEDCRCDKYPACVRCLRTELKAMKNNLILSKNESFIIAGLIKELVLIHGHDKTQDEKEIIDKIFKYAYPEKHKE